jgi:6-phosphogluconate dehydrogenase
MEIGMYGLGRMGMNMTKRLVQNGHRVVVHNRSPGPVEEAAEIGAVPSASVEDFVNQLTPPRAVWSMVPAGKPTESVIETLREHLEAGDIIVDGGNSKYTDSLHRAVMLREKDIHFVDVGVSGGIWGLKEGYGLMIGGPDEAVERLTPIFESLAPAPDKGWGHVGPNGAGHFVKMVHNGIEYGIMQAYAEGFAIMQAKGEFDLDLRHVAEIWRFGTVIRSWLLDLTERALSRDIDAIEAWVDDSGEGRWTVQEAVDLAVPAPVITDALYARFRSRRPENFGDKLLAALRNEFGGHAVKEGC